MELELLLSTLAAFGWQGLVLAGVILLGVFIAKLSGIVATGNHARIANIVLGAILYGLGENPEAEGALMAAISSLLAGLAFELIDWLKKRKETE